MRNLSVYELGNSGLIALQADQRFSYALHVPEGYLATTSAVQKFDVIVAIHGSNRPVMAYRDGFSELARRVGCFVLAPLFPIGIIEPGDVDNYKYLAFKGLRYDLILLAMLAEIETRYGVEFQRVVMHGFSGGGQFVHRFYYLHAERLTGVSIGAPGKVTLLDNTRPWWVGTADVEQRFGRKINLDALQAVKVQLVVGKDDIDDREIYVEEGSRNWMEGANDAGRTRRERIRTLHENLRDHRIDARLDIVPGVAHAGRGPILLKAIEFFEGLLA